MLSLLPSAPGRRAFGERTPEGPWLLNHKNDGARRGRVQTRREARPATCSVYRFRLGPDLSRRADGVTPLGLSSKTTRASLKSRSCVRNACDHASGARKQCSKVNTFEGWGVFCFLSAVSVLFFALAASCISMALAGQPKLGCVSARSSIRAAPKKELARGLLRNRRPLLWTQRHGARPCLRDAVHRDMIATGGSGGMTRYARARIPL